MRMASKDQKSPIPELLLQAFPPDADSLLARCCDLAADDLLEEISQADYGIDASRHFAALKLIRDARAVPALLDWYPREVLELVRWSEPLDDWSVPTDLRRHAMRAFCCAALLRSAAEPASSNYAYGENQTLVGLIASALCLKNGLPDAAGRFLTWRIPTLDLLDDERPFFVFGLVALSILSDPPRVAASDIDQLVRLIEDAEAEIFDPSRVYTLEMFESSFLDGTCHDLRHASWRHLAHEMLASHPQSASLSALVKRMNTNRGAI